MRILKSFHQKYWLNWWQSSANAKVFHVIFICLLVYLNINHRKRRYLRRYNPKGGDTRDAFHGLRFQRMGLAKIRRSSWLTDILHDWQDFLKMTMLSIVKILWNYLTHMLRCMYTWMIILATVCITIKEIMWQNKRTDGVHDMRNKIEKQLETIIINKIIFLYPSSSIAKV